MQKLVHLGCVVRSVSQGRQCGAAHPGPPYYLGAQLKLWNPWKGMLNNTFCGMDCHTCTRLGLWKGMLNITFWVMKHQACLGPACLGPADPAAIKFIHTCSGASAFSVPECTVARVSLKFDHACFGLCSTQWVQISTSIRYMELIFYCIAV